MVPGQGKKISNQGWTAYEDGCLYLELDKNSTSIEENSVLCRSQGARMIVLDKKSKWDRPLLYSNNLSRGRYSSIVGCIANCKYLRVYNRTKAKSFGGLQFSQKTIFESNEQKLLPKNSIFIE